MVPYQKTSLGVVHEVPTAGAGLSRQSSGGPEYTISRASSGRLTQGLYKTPSGGIDEHVVRACRLQPQQSLFCICFEATLADLTAGGLTL